MGGFLAVCTTDFVQGTLMLIALLVVPIVAWGFVSGDFSALLTQEWSEFRTLYESYV